MSRRRPLFTAIAVACGKAAGLTSGTHTIQSSGKNHSYILKVPDNYDNNPYRLIFGLHWLGGTATDVRSPRASATAAP